MPEVSLEIEYSRWSIPEHPVRIEYAPRILTAIEREALDGFHRLRKGGVEVGGVLFGARNGQAVTIVDFRPLTCEHALGPGFVLSDRDRQALRALLGSPATDPTLRGLIPVGWYRSNTRSHIHLSSQDLAFFEKQFPESWQIVLVLKPDTFLPTKAGFFFREADGRIRADSSYREFSLPPRNSPTAARKADCDRPIERAAVVPRASLPVVSLSAPQPSPGARSPLWLAAIAAGLVAIVLAWLAIPRTVESSPEPLALALEERDGQLRITWNRTATPILQHPSGQLEIREDDETALTVDLDRIQLQTGTVTYKRSSRNVGVSMKVGKTEETVLYVGRLPEHGLLAKREAADRASLVAERPSTTEPDSDIAKVASDKVKGEHYLNKPRAHTLVTRVLTPKRREPAPVSLQIPPQIERVATSAPSSPWLGNLPALPAPAVPPTPAAATPSRTGALIWTGRLSKNEVLSIHGTRASTGSLTGALPGQPVRIRVYPAELTHDGISVYSSDERHPQGHTELPAARNGWNKTSYVRDSRVTEALKVLEAPATSNAWNRLMLRHERGKLSVVLVEWELLSR